MALGLALDSPENNILRVYARARVKNLLDYLTTPTLTAFIIPEVFRFSSLHKCYICLHLGEVCWQAEEEGCPSPISAIRVDPLDVLRGFFPNGAVVIRSIQPTGDSPKPQTGRSPANASACCGPVWTAG